MFALLPSVSYAEEKLGCPFSTFIAKACYDEKVSVREVLRLYYNYDFDEEQVLDWTEICMSVKGLKKFGYDWEKLESIIEDICGGTDV